ncbi:MAG: hypothetical protein KDE14_13300 [Rhodobacteraceae bacterium]|nr:hypothetical protein [Paracoccaceae bacterium]
MDGNNFLMGLKSVVTLRERATATGRSIRSIQVENQFGAGAPFFQFNGQKFYPIAMLPESERESCRAIVEKREIQNVFPSPPAGVRVGQIVALAIPKGGSDE